MIRMCTSYPIGAILDNVIRDLADKVEHAYDRSLRLIQVFELQSLILNGKERFQVFNNLFRQLPARFLPFTRLWAIRDVIHDE